MVFPADGVILCLGQTKRGTEQRVVLRNQKVIHFFHAYLSRIPCKDDERFFAISYSSSLRWIRKLCQLLDPLSPPLSTHTFRRSGASELSRVGTPLSDILLFGRWNTERSAREYIRKGEVAIYKYRQYMDVETKRRVEAWANRCTTCWQLFDQLCSGRQPMVPCHRVTRHLLSLRSIFSNFDLPVVW